MVPKAVAVKGEALDEFVVVTLVATLRPMSLRKRRTVALLASSFVRRKWAARGTLAAGRIKRSRVIF
jgi:hypothetical protein